MKNLFFLAMIIFNCSCSMNKLKTEEQPVATEIVQVPIFNNKRDTSIFFNTQKVGSKTKNGFKYDLYYGTGGRYIMQVISPNDSKLDFSTAEGTLSIETDQDPETISLATTNTGLFSGFGLPRNGQVRIKFTLFMPESKYASLINEEFDYLVIINDIN